MRLLLQTVLAFTLVHGVQKRMSCGTILSCIEEMVGCSADHPVFSKMVPEPLVQGDHTLHESELIGSRSGAISIGC